jgi:hypothetical protein
MNISPEPTKKKINILMIARSNTVVAKEKDGMLLW